MMAMAKTRRGKKGKQKPWTPPTEWDMGPKTAEQSRRKVIEDAHWIDPETGERKNPNGVKRARRISMVELLYKREKLTQRQFSAGEAILYAWERNAMTPPAIRKVQVDTSTRPDAHIAIMIDRISGFSWVMAKVPIEARALVLHVCCEDAALTEFPGFRRNETLAELQAALDVVADGIGL